MLILGEVQTTALRHSGSVPRELAESALGLVAGERVRVSERPVSYATSPDVLTGVDCSLAARPGARGVGTLTGRVCLTGGLVLQGSVLAPIDPVAAGRRQPWSHYLARPGVVEAIGRADLPGVVATHLASGRDVSTMGMGAFAARLLDDVQGCPALDRHTPIRARRTVLRWAALHDEEVDGVRVRFTVREDGLRTVFLLLGSQETAEIADLCEDLAMHDWLLTALLSVIDHSRIGVAEPAHSVERLRPAVDRLLHLWMPAARLGGFAPAVWGALEDRPGLSRQWEASVQRIRDQMAMAAALATRTAGAPQLFP
ncbi:SCO2521 family protein [Actinoplanes sp. NBC_00393]|uniref:SCO2521 family protein n=1 Tax=Actinoplanes sp. NBC_00393 TaxID=2975953 RepID=UPI002E1EDA42